MKLGLLSTAWSQTGRITARDIRRTKAIGFDTLAVQCDPLTLSEAETQALLAAARDSRLPVDSVCCEALGLSDRNESVRFFHLNRCRRHLDFCAALGASNLLVVLGDYLWEQAVVPPREQWGWAVAQIRELGQQAQSLGRRLSLRLEPFRWSLLSSIEAMVAFLDEVGLPSVVGAACDLAHLHLRQVSPSELGRLAGRIEQVWLADSDGRAAGHLPPGQGHAPLSDYLAAIKATGFDGVVSVVLEPAPSTDRLEDWVLEAYAQADRVMQSLECRY